MKTILLVDDDEDFHEALAAAVVRRGFSVQHASNGREALQRLNGGARPDAILIDLMMPDMDGWQLLEAMGRDPDLAGIPSAVMSASTNRGGLPARVSHLPKPCDLRELLDLLNRLCGLTEQL